MGSGTGTPVSTVSYELLVSTDLDYLIGSLRLHLGDTAIIPTFTDGKLRKALVDGFKSLDKRWQCRYDISSTYIVTRSTDWKFTDAISPVIQVEDERPIVLMASIIMKRGTLQNSSSNYGSWRDDEISYSNIAGGQTLQESIRQDQMELDSILPSRANKLARISKQSLLGYNLAQGNYSED